MSLPKPQYEVDVEITLRTRVVVRADSRAHAEKLARRKVRGYLDLRPGWCASGTDGKLYVQPFTIGEPHSLEFVSVKAVSCAAAPGPECAACADKGLHVVHGGN